MEIKDSGDELEDRRKNWGTTDDIFECNKCNHQGPALAPIVTDWVPSPFGRGNVPMYTLDDDRLECEECGSTDIVLFVRKPTNLPRSSDREEALIEADPDWRERFGGDVERAYDFYFRG